MYYIYWISRKINLVKDSMIYIVFFNSEIRASKMHWS